MHRRARFAAIALSATVALVAGCGGGSSGGGNTGTTGGTGTNNASQPPSAELQSALSNLSKASTLTATLKLGASAGQIKSFVSSQGSTISDSGANALASASISIEVQAPSGKTLADGSSGAAVNLGVSANNTGLLTFRDVNKVLYIQVDLKDLLNDLGRSSTYQEVEASQAQFPKFAQDLLAGKFVSLPVSTLQSITGSSSSGGSSSNAVISLLKSILTSDVTVTRTGQGDTDTLKLTGSTEKIATNLKNGLANAVPTFGSLLGGSVSAPPNKTTTLTATVNGGALSSLSLDLAQFAKKPSAASFPVNLTFAQSGPDISAPSGATPVDTAGLAQLLGAFSSGFGSAT